MCLCGGVRRPVCFAPPAWGWREPRVSWGSAVCLCSAGPRGRPALAGAARPLPRPLPPPPRKSIRRTPSPVQPAAAFLRALLYRSRCTSSVAGGAGLRVEYACVVPVLILGQLGSEGAVRPLGASGVGGYARLALCCVRGAGPCPPPARRPADPSGAASGAGRPSAGSEFRKVDGGGGSG